MRRAVQVLVLLNLLFASRFPTAECGSSSQQNNPYAVLGVKKDASQEEIRQRYRNLCLRFHPDKNTRLPEAEQKDAELQFKSVQDAYALIGRSDARRAYDNRQAFGGESSSTTGTFNDAFYPRYSENARDAFAQAFRSYQAQQQFPAASFPYFRFNTSSNIFNQRSPHQGGFPIWNPTALKSKYVQRVKVSLEDLYNGKSNMVFTLQGENRWTRYRAAFRGKIAYIILYQSLLYALPLLRITRRWVVAVLTIILFDQQLPSLDKKNHRRHHYGSSSSLDNTKKVTFQAAIKAGYKQGTRLTFQTSDPMVEVVFILTEAKHDCYRRDGNDLHVNVSITRRQAQEGSQIELKSLDHSTPTLQVTIPPRRIQSSGDCMIIEGMGWPIRKTSGEHGDLVVHFDIVSSRKQMLHNK